MGCMGKKCYLQWREVGSRISSVRKAIAPVITFFAGCVWLGLLPPPRLHNVWIAVLSVLYFPIYLIRNPWNGLTVALLTNLALGVLLLLIAACANLFIWAKRRLLRGPH